MNLTLREMLSKLELILSALTGVLILLPILVWVIFNHWQIWARLLEVQLGKLAKEVDVLQGQKQNSEGIIGTLKEYIEMANQVMNTRLRHPSFLTLKESSDMATLISITREMVKTIRMSPEPISNILRYLEIH